MSHSPCASAEILVNFCSPPNILLEWLKLQTSNFVHWLPLWSNILGTTNCPSVFVVMWPIFTAWCYTIMVLAIVVCLSSICLCHRHVYVCLSAWLCLDPLEAYNVSFSTQKSKKFLAISTILDYCSLQKQNQECIKVCHFNSEVKTFSGKRAQPLARPLSSGKEKHPPHISPLQSSCHQRSTVAPTSPSMTSKIHHWYGVGRSSTLNIFPSWHQVQLNR